LRDAIVTSGWNWDALNVPERLALALAGAGARVLYCENPVSFLGPSRRPLHEVQRNVFVLRPVFLGHRLNQYSQLSELQAFALGQQIARAAKALGLKDPVFFYPHAGYCRALAARMKDLGFDLVHICMDYEILDHLEHVRLSNITLAIPEEAFLELRRSFGDKIRKLPQFAAPNTPDGAPGNSPASQTIALSEIPTPRLVYLGNVEGRVNLELVKEVLDLHPEWHFVSFGSANEFVKPNWHIFPWGPLDRWASLLAADGTIGFLPYDCSDPKNFHCVPLKLFDYFALGLPVVGTPIAYLLEFPELVYLGNTAKELSEAARLALEEPKDSPKRTKRSLVAAEHSIDKLSHILSPLLDEEGELGVMRRKSNRG
jgi:hypothetical protein